MAAAAKILDTLQSLGITAEAIGPDRLRFQPASRIPSGLVPRLWEAKTEILKALANRPARLPATEVELHFEQEKADASRSSRRRVAGKSGRLLRGVRYVAVCTTNLRGVAD